METETITSIADVLIDNPKFPAKVCQAVRAARREKVWRGTRSERIEKFKTFLSLLNGATNSHVTISFKDDGDNDTSMQSRVKFDPDNIINPHIEMVGKLSLATFLYLFATAQQRDDEQMTTHFGRWRWAANIFKRFFPQSFSRLDISGPYLLEQVSQS